MFDDEIESDALKTPRQPRAKCSAVGCEKRHDGIAGMPSTEMAFAPA
jgi:hypothetical protein